MENRSTAAHYLLTDGLRNAARSWIIDPARHPPRGPQVGGQPDSSGFGDRQSSLRFDDAGASLEV